MCYTIQYCFFYMSFTRHVEKTLVGLFGNKGRPQLIKLLRFSFFSEILKKTNFVITIRYEILTFLMVRLITPLPFDHPLTNTNTKIIPFCLVLMEALTHPYGKKSTHFRKEIINYCQLLPDFPDTKYQKSYVDCQQNEEEQQEKCLFPERWMLYIHLFKELKCPS